MCAAASEDYAGRADPNNGLRCCRLTAPSCRSLTSALSDSSALRELNLSENNFEDWGLKLLSDRLRKPQCRLKILRKDTDDGGPSISNSSSVVSIPTCSQSIAPNVAAPPCPQVRPAVIQDSTVFIGRSRKQNAFQFSSVHSESKAMGDNDAPKEMEAPVTAVKCLVTNTLPAISLLQISSDPGWSRRDFSSLPHSPSMPSLSQITSEKHKTFTRAKSLPAILLNTSFEEFTPDITADESDETYRFQCSCPGLYQCSVTGLVFHMEGEGEVVYRIVPWNRRLAQHHKKPAGPV
ncbi:uncharacterized protein LOC120563598 [Perca fluviatilis]|uniref:uncharacterized protein LOC120563598 n=1 Tax=Perca fluviatilis TaxID=8168 RepID=UPI0019641209|nr:uncharacterized protein LOC120563598 [Perca fluviatilis]